MDIERVVVTGATSMLGVSFIEECIKNHTQVLAVVRKNSLTKDRLPSSSLVQVIECDLSDLSSLPDQKQSFDAFYHFGWQGTNRKDRINPDIQIENIKYTLDAVRLAKRLGCKVFIGAGSQAEYGPVKAKLSSQTPVNPDTAYGIAKFAASKTSLILSDELGIRHIWVRVLSVYGPYDGEHTMIMSGIRQMQERQRPLYTKGEQLWDYLYCGDAARAFYLMGDKTDKNAIYCLGSGNARPIRDYIEIMRNAIDPSMEIGLGEIEYPPNQIMYLCADIENLKSDTGFVPQVGFEEGIKKTIDWYREKTCEKYKKQ